jgi:copper homeostasis protein
MKIEICVDSVEGAMAAERGGADRVELCDNLMEGGTTPSAGCIRLARHHARIGLHVIIRPRGGDFLYSDLEMAVMEEDIRLARELGADGVVIGCLTASGEIDVSRTRHLASLARPLNVTFHRAFDMCRDPRAGLEDLVALGVDRVLTSGQEASVMEGLELIADLQKQAAGRIVVMPGGGITLRNVSRVVAATRVSEVHLSARVARESGMKFRNTSCFMGGALRPPEFSLKQTDESTIRAIATCLNSAKERERADG